MIQQHSRIFVLGETEDEVGGLRTYLKDTYPEIQIVGGAAVEEDTQAEGVMNEINSLTVDVIVSGLQGHRQDRLAIENRSQLNNKNLVLPGRTSKYSDRCRFKSQLVEHTIKEKRLQTNGSKNTMSASESSRLRN